MDHRILYIILTNLEEELDDAEILPARRRWVQVLGTYLAICFVCSLRGNEGFIAELGGVIQHIYDGKGENEELPHLVIPLLGKLKNENGQKCHLMMAAIETASGFKPRVWTERLLIMLLTE